MRWTMKRQCLNLHTVSAATKGNDTLAAQLAFLQEYMYERVPESPTTPRSATEATTNARMTSSESEFRLGQTWSPLSTASRLHKMSGRTPYANSISLPNECGMIAEGDCDGAVGEMLREEKERRIEQLTAEVCMLTERLCASEEAQNKMVCVCVCVRARVPVCLQICV